MSKNYRNTIYSYVNVAFVSVFFWHLSRFYLKKSPSKKHVASHVFTCK